MKPGYDRAGAAYEQLQPFDGRFAANVLLQAKNGPIDFQPREPFQPLFGAMPRTQVIPEFQITQEYLGFSNHLAFRSNVARVFDSDTYAKGPGSTVTKVVDGSLYHQRITGIAGVANTGSDRNWTGHHLAQANWYAFGRLAWNPDVSSQQIAGEWIAMTFTHEPSANRTIARMMVESHEAVVDYMTPLGLHHLFGVAIITGRRPGGTPRSAMIGTCLPSRERRRHWVRSDGEGQRNRQPVSSPRTFLKHKQLPGEVSALVSSCAMGPSVEIQTNSLGRAGSALPARRGLGKRHAQAMGRS
jgi:alpha-glucuronidase